jgi:cyclopropane fatty-acyl-phospholipid synthase-like methyltransferase
MSADAPYPELKKTHTIARQGRPWRDVKPPPSSTVWQIIQGFGSYWALLAAVELGVFDELARRGPSPVDELAPALDASPGHLRHLLDALVAMTLIDQVADVYELTEAAERYLCTDGAASMAALVRVAPGPHGNWERLAETVRRGAVAEPVDGSFYRPLVEATFATQLRAATRLGLRAGWARRAGLRVLDLGAGRAPWAIAVLEQSPGSSAVVHDLPDVIDGAGDELRQRGLGDRVTLLPGDYLEVTIEPASFDVVVLGHVCRAEGAARAEALVQRAHAALVDGGQLVLADYFADDGRTRSPFAVQMGLTMAANTAAGGLVTNGEVHRWLVAAGFEAIRLVEPIGFNFAYLATAAHRRHP